MKRTLYDIVGVPAGVPRELIAASCRRRIGKLEAQGDDAARAEIYAIREAWAILGDEKLRAGYDASLATPQAGPAVDPAVRLQAEIGGASVVQELVRPRSLPGNLGRWPKLFGLVMSVGLIATFAAWNQGGRIAAQKKVEAAEYEAEHGEPPPKPGAAPAAPAPKADAEPFSAEKYEQELKAREAEIRDQVAKDQAAQEDEFRRKQEGEGGSRGRRTRYR